MITLNSEQGLVDVENWEDIESLPGFVADLNPTEHKLDSIIGRYHFKDMIPCGLSDCHTAHGKGYVVVTKKGSTTNIGHDCGKKYFGVDFQELSRKFERHITESNNRSRLCSFSFQVEEIERAISDLRERPRGADWVYKKTRPLVTKDKGCPDEVVRRISAMVRSGTNTLTVEREATVEEVEMLEAAQGRSLPRPHVIQESVADIAGLQALYPENDLRALLVVDLETNLRAFKEKDIDTMTYDELRHWNKWTDSVENTLERAANAVGLGGALLAPANLEPFNQVLTWRDDKALFRSYLKGLPE